MKRKASQLRSMEPCSRLLVAVPLLLLVLRVAAAIATTAAGTGGVSPTRSTRYDRVFSFGDSLTDTGNALHLPATAAGPSSRPPYGETFFRRPTGRASDGRLVIDFIVEALGVPHPTPYLAVAAGKSAAEAAADFHRRGVNFAFGGATALGPDFFESRGLTSFVPVSLRNQTAWFNNVVRLLGSESEQRRKSSMSMASSLFLVGEIGVNDYFVGLNENRTVAEVLAFVPHVVSAIRSLITEVIGAGARTVVVPGMIPLGCEPQLLTLYEGTVGAAGYDPESGCITRLNGLAERHNRALRTMLGGLRRAHPGTTIVYADLYRAVTDIIVSPREYGFRHSRRLDACCGRGGGGGGGGAYNYDDAAFCGAAGAAACADPSRYVSWDGVHYTEAANRVVACSVLLNGSRSHGHGGADDDDVPTTTLSDSWATTEDWLHRIGCGSS